jgi:hypothetical protein
MLEPHIRKSVHWYASVLFFCSNTNYSSQVASLQLNHETPLVDQLIAQLAKSVALQDEFGIKIYFKDRLTAETDLIKKGAILCDTDCGMPGAVIVSKENGFAHLPCDESAIWLSQQHAPDGKHIHCLHGIYHDITCTI